MAPELWEEGAEEDAVPDDAPQPTALLIRPEDLRTSLPSIWANRWQAYYVSPCWHTDFYISLAYSGFISVSQAVPARSGGEAIPLLIPEIQRSYGVLRFADLHIERNVRRRAPRYELRFDSAFEEVLGAICGYHDNCWLLPEYQDLLRTVHRRGPVPISLSKDGAAQFRVHSVELVDKDTGALAAGELGYVIGSVFTSLTGFTGAGFPSAGKVQLVGLACALERAGATLWNLGHPPREATDRLPASMLYKREIGVTVVSRRDFLHRWLHARDRTMIRLPGAAGAAPWVDIGGEVESPGPRGNGRAETMPVGPPAPSATPRHVCVAPRATGSLNVRDLIHDWENRHGGRAMNQASAVGVGSGSDGVSDCSPCPGEPPPPSE